MGKVWKGRGDGEEGRRTNEVTYISSWCLLWGKHTWRRRGGGRADEVIYINFLLGICPGEGTPGGGGEMGREGEEPMK